MDTDVLLEQLILLQANTEASLIRMGESLLLLRVKTSSFPLSSVHLLNMINCFNNV